MATNAFTKYLLILPELTAAQHLADSLYHGGELAYELVELIHGEDWKTNDVMQFCLDTIREVKQQQKESTE